MYRDVFESWRMKSKKKARKIIKCNCGNLFARKVRKENYGNFPWKKKTYVYGFEGHCDKSFEVMKLEEIIQNI